MSSPPPVAYPWPAGSLRRSVGLFRVFLKEQSDPDLFYATLAEDSVAELSRWRDLAGADVLDVGGGPGYFADAFTRAGARYLGVEPDAGELTAHGGPGGISVRASGLALPFGDGSFAVTYSSNVLEHVADPERMAQEMVRVTVPGGVIVLSWTPWLSPWGGHETSPWHYLLGGRGAADRYAAKHGHRPKNDYGRSLFSCSVARMVRWARAGVARAEIDVMEVLPRYHPSWARWVIRLPGAREVLSWNAVLVVTKRR